MTATRPLPDDLPGDPPAPAPDEDGDGPGGPGGGAADGTSVFGGERMPPWLPRGVLLVFTAIIGFMLLRWAFGHLRGFLIDLLIALFLSLAIEPAVDRLARRGMRRGLATGLVFVVVTLAFAAVLAAIGSLLVDQIVNLARNLPDHIQSLLDWINKRFDTDLTMEKIQGGLFKDSNTVQGYAETVADNALGFGTALVGGLFELFTIGLFTFYFAAEGPRLRRGVCSLLPPGRQAEVLRAWEIAIDKTGGYLYSRALMALVSAVAHYIFFLVIGLDYAIALAIWVGLVSQFIPTVGTYLAAALPALVALTESPMDAVWVIVFATAYQQFENYLLHPRITSMTVDIHPAVAFGSVIAGAALLGPTGALIAIPVTATTTAFFGTYVRRYDVAEHRLAPDAPAKPARKRRKHKDGSGDAPGGAGDDATG
ncbi:AI-2E family transporter [Yinghuangia soli]|uniref:AI-2E family transporter n=1 Tax=Yinghuangia soli TaxID=2908204 RepID=A0AA41Q9R5_9ACTN|nr:AI-2E family transporter [Yinghuangia soli]MCF2532812.1 AI-2E family transporter [Yinghuangia soli]